MLVSSFKINLGGKMFVLINTSRNTYRNMLIAITSSLVIYVGDLYLSGFHLEVAGFWSINWRPAGNVRLATVKQKVSAK